MPAKRPLIQPRTLKGFRDFLPASAIPREEMMSRARSVFRSYGFAPIDTPALEYEEILTGKGGEESDKQMLRFEDGGKRKVALRFDLTVPFARFAAQYHGELGLPFKRYHIGPVWRGEKPQLGRYREFVQCDFDTIGTSSIAPDVETALVIHDLLLAIGIEGFCVRVNHRKILTGLLEQLGLVERSTEVLRALDKLAKIGADAVVREMVTTSVASEEQARRVLELASIQGEGMFERLAPLVGETESGAAGLEAMGAFVAAVDAAGIPSERIVFDLSIARGLDYYTGIVYETFLDDLPGIGSVCSGGRYDNLAELYSKQTLPGVGASLGLDRLLAALEELGRVARRSTPADLFVPWFVKERLGDYLALTRRLRAEGLSVELYPEPKKLGAQLKYADRRGFPLALIIGDDEFEASRAQLKVLESGESHELDLAGGLAPLLEAVRAALA